MISLINQSVFYLKLVAFLVGVCGVLISSSLMPVYGLIPAVSCTALLWRAQKYPALMYCLIGFSWTLAYAHFIKPQALDSGWQNRIVTVQGRVIDLPVQTQEKARFLLAVNALSINNLKPVQISAQQVFSGSLLVSWYSPAQRIRTGDIWRLQVKLRRPGTFFSPGSFDFETWAFEKGISATGYVRTSPENGRTGVFHGWFAWNRLRQAVADRLAVAVSSPAALGMINALATGDTRALSSRHWRLLRNTGTVHLVVISGLHIGLLAGIGFLIGRWLWSCSYRLTLIIAAPKIGAISGLFFAFAYAGLAGFSLPTQRALLMTVAFLVLTIVQKPATAFQRMRAAALMIVVADPFSLLSVSFYLSFVAVLALLLISQLRLRVSWWQSLVSGQFYFVALLTPLNWFFFQTVAWVAPLANLLAIPLFTLLLVPLVLLTVVLLFIQPQLVVYVMPVLEWLIEYVWVVLERLDIFDADSTLLSLNSYWGVVAVITGVLLLLYSPALRLRTAGLFFLLPLIMPVNAALKAGQFRLAILDVGQGLAILVRTKNHSLLYDTGPAYRSGFNTGDRVVIPYLKYYHLPGLDKLMISHLDIDHAGGLDAIMRHKFYRPRKLIASDPIKRYQSFMELCTRDQNWAWDNVRFEVLHPRFHNLHKRRNNKSCVLKISTGSFAVLIPGDIHASIEKILVSTYKASSKLEATVLIAPHHGSNTSSSMDFIKTVKPLLVVISAGFANRFGFPKSSVIRRYRIVDARILNTANHGTIEFQFDAKTGVQHVVSWRISKGRFWHRTDSVIYP